MLTQEQLDEMQRQMEEEHRRDREALERMKRFLPSNGSSGVRPVSTAPAPVPAAAPVWRPPQSNDSRGAIPAPNTIIGRMETFMRSTPDEHWTTPKMIDRFHSMPDWNLFSTMQVKTVSLNFAKLLERGVIEMVQRGSGRKPHVYRWRRQQ